MRDSELRVTGRVLGYARVSSAEQALGTSLQDQQDAITAYAHSRGLKIFRFYIEAESSVYEKFEKREQIQALLAEVRSGDLVVCDKLDRWSRAPEFTYGSIRRILEADAAFYAVGDRCDPSTPDGDTMLNVRVLVAREEHKRIKERLVGTRRGLKQAGYYVDGLVPLGYKRQKDPKARVDRNALLIDEAGAEVVRAIYRMCIAGKSISTIEAHLRETQKSRGWDKKGLHWILRNRLYLGEILDTRGNWIKGRHEPILSPDIFVQAQESLASRRLGGRVPTAVSHTKTWLLRHIAKCARCGAKITSAYGAGDRKKKYTYYYRCAKTCGGGYIPVTSTDEAASELVLARLGELRERIASGSDTRGPAAKKLVDFAAEREKIQKRRDRYHELWTDGDMTRDEMRAQLVKLDDRRLKLEAAEVVQAKSAVLQKPAARRATLAEIDRMRTAWTRATPEVKREILRELAKSARIARGRDPVLEWRSPEEIAANVSI